MSFTVSAAVLSPKFGIVNAAELYSSRAGYFVGSVKQLCIWGQGSTRARGFEFEEL